jgi:uncharacterized membrane protein YidH (DUF202 family)
MNGAPGERTVLAWNRTGLAVLALATVVFRLQMSTAPALAVVMVAICAPLGLVVLIGGIHRTRVDARLPFAMAMLITAVGIVELLGIVVQ